MADQESYFYERKYMITKKFIQSCYACFMSHEGSRKSIKKKENWI